jgi:hypothetical protein
MRRLGDLLIPVYDFHRYIFAKVVADRGTGLKLRGNGAVR